MKKTYLIKQSSKIHSYKFKDGDSKRICEMEGFTSEGKANNLATVDGDKDYQQTQHQ
jgi:hypothetical protein